MRFITAILIITLAGCGRLDEAHPASPASSSLVQPLQTAFNTNLAEYKAATAAQDGQPSLTDCDDTVWAGDACLGGAAVTIADLEYPNPGQVQRRPKATGACWQPTGGTQPSASTASRDDVVEYMSCALATKDVGALERLQTYAQANNGYLGQPADAGLTLMTPTLNAVLARSIDRLGGQGGDAGVVIEAPGIKDYQQHIEVVEVLLSTAANGGEANGWELGLLKSLTLTDPDDALFAAAEGVYSGDCTTAPQLLLANPVAVPSYVRGDQPALFAKAWWLRAAALVLSHCKES